MQFFSTRDQNRKVTSSEAIAQGPVQRGRSVCTGKLSAGGCRRHCASWTTPEMAAAISGAVPDRLFPGLPDRGARKHLRGGFLAARQAILPRWKGDTYALELWHGPTCAFKDYALQLMPKLLVEAKKNLNRTEKTLILVATSGDTGKAALDGYHDIPGVEIAVFYPTGGTSEIQRLQMATQEGANVAVYAVRGNFDDAQTGVKRVFGDGAIAAELAKRKYPPVQCQFDQLGPPAAADRLLLRGLCTAAQGRKDRLLTTRVDFCVPTGNFGDILAGYYAKRMGLPVGASWSAPPMRTTSSPISSPPAPTPQSGSSSRPLRPAWTFWSRPIWSVCFTMSPAAIPRWPR